MPQAPWQFLATASPAERRALVASTLGWMLDGMDVTLYAMVIAELLREFELTAAQAGLLASLTLIASAAGGILFGVLADRAGRRRALMASILVYSVFTAACGLSRTVMELAVFRFLLGLGMGGEWATGTALVLPRWGWRAVFFVGILPALVTLWIRRGVEESPLWAAQRLPRSSASHSGGGRARFRLTFASRYRRPILVTLLMNSAALFGWWGLFTWIPTYLALPATQGGRGLTIGASSLWIVTMQAGMWLGYVTFGFVSDTVGGKGTYVAYLLLAAALVPLYARAQAPTSLLLLGPLVAFFGTGHFTGFGIITAELFPTSFRASAMGFTYNFGRALSAAAPWLMGWVAEHRSLNSAFWISGVAFLLAGLFGLTVPETRGRSLEAK